MCKSRLTEHQKHRRSLLVEADERFKDIRQRRIFAATGRHL